MCEKILANAQDFFLPVKGDVPLCSDKPVCNRRRVCPRYNDTSIHMLINNMRSHQLGDTAFGEKNVVTRMRIWRGCLAVQRRNKYMYSSLKNFKVLGGN